MRKFRIRFVIRKFLLYRSNRLVERGIFDEEALWHSLLGGEHWIVLRLKTTLSIVKVGCLRLLEKLLQETITWLSFKIRMALKLTDCELKPRTSFPPTICKRKMHQDTNDKRPMLSSLQSIGNESEIR